MMNRQALKSVEPGQRVGVVLPGKQVEIVTVVKTTRINIWLENGMVFNKKFGHRVRNTSDRNEWNAGHLVHPETAAQMLGTYHLKEKNWDPKTHNREVRRLRKTAMDKASPVEWDKKTLPKLKRPLEKPAVCPHGHETVTKLPDKDVKAANKATKQAHEKHDKTLADKLAAIVKKTDTKRATETVNELFKAFHARQIFGSLYELNQQELQMAEKLLATIKANTESPVEKQSAKEKQPAKPQLRAVYGNWSLQHTRKSWAIADANDKVIRRNAYSGGAGAVVTYRTQEAAEKKIKTMLGKEVTNA